MSKENVIVPDFDLSQSNRLHRRLQIRAVSGLVIVSLLLGAVFTWRLYRAEATQLEADLSAAMKLQAIAIGAELDRLKNITTQITSRTRIRQELENFNQGQIDKGTLIHFSHGKLADAMRMMPDVAGISRLNTRGQLLIQVGEFIPPSFWPKDFLEKSIQIGHPQENEGRHRLVLSAPILNRQQGMVGIDLVAFDYRRLNSIFQGFFHRYQGKGHLLVTDRMDATAILFLASAAGQTESLSQFPNLQSSVVLDHKGGFQRYKTSIGNKILFSERLENGTWFLSYFQDVRSFYAPAYDQAVYAVLFITTSTLIGCILTVLAISPLAGRISVETNSLFQLFQKHKQLLSKIQVSESRLQEAQRVAHIGSWELSLPDRQLWWSDELYRVYEVELDREISYSTFLSSVHPEDRDKVEQVYSRTRPGQPVNELVYRVVLNDERIKFLKDRFEPLFDESGHALRIIGTTQDITEQFCQQQEKNRLHALLDALVEGSSDVIFVKNREGQYLLANEAMAQLVGKQKKDVIGQDDFGLVKEEYAKRFRNDDLRIMQGGETETYEESLFINGKTYSFLTTKGPLIIDDLIQGVFGIAREISDRKRTEERLRESEESYRGLFNYVQDGIYILDLEGRFIDVNRSVEKMYGYDRTHFVGKQFVDLSADWKNEFLEFFQIWQRVLSGTVQHFQFWGRRSDDHAFPEDIILNIGRFRGQEVVFAVARDISETMEQEARLARAESEWVQAMDKFDDAIYLIDMERHLVRANQAFYRKIGGDAVHCVGRPISELIHPGVDSTDCAVCLAQEEQREGVFIVEANDPSNPFGYPIEVTVKQVCDTQGVVGKMLLIIKDLSKIRQTEERLRLAASVFENTGEGVVITDADGKIVEINRAFSEIMGYQRRDVIGKNPRIWQSGRHDRKFFRNMWHSLKTTGEWRGELWNQRKDGTVLPELLTISQVLDDHGQLTHYVGVFTDISQLKRSQEQLDFLAHHDSLTGLPNRLLLDERLNQAILHAERKGSQLAIIFQDLDNFKNINDSFGHPVGDQLISNVASRLLSVVRKDDTVARLGGDEFVTLLENIDRPEHVSIAAEKLMSAFDEPFKLDDQEIRVTTSLGISLYPGDGTDVATLLRNADAAMYRAKEDGRNAYQFYTEELTRNALERVYMENNLRRAIDEGQLFLVYQPQIGFRDNRIIGVEALLRWKHPELGMVSPAKFIPLAEECGLIIPIGEWVLKSACKQGKLWLDKGIDFGCIAVNVSGVQIQRGRMVDTVKTALEKTGFTASKLELEVTEGFIMQQTEYVVGQLKELRHLGVTLSIDDFGTGYSSLSYLKTLPIHKLKIDQSFVRDIPIDPNDMAISDAIIAMGHSLGLTVIAEGVETDAQREFLMQAGCQEAQGYFFGKPLSPDELENRLSQSFF